jgi:hypothetical protein
MAISWANRTRDSGSIDASPLLKLELRFVVGYIQAAWSQPFDQGEGVARFGGIVTGSIR